MNKEWKKGFPPVCDDNSRVLILGSFPSVKSREIGFYYGHPQNRFWKMLSVALGSPVPESIDGKISFLKSRGVALWDIIETADITGSSDADITNDKSTVSDIKNLVKKLGKLEKIICNGKKAYSETLKEMGATDVKIDCLPSTSPRNVSYDQTAWICALSFLKDNAE